MRNTIVAIIVFSLCGVAYWWLRGRPTFAEAQRSPSTFSNQNEITGPPSQAALPRARAGAKAVAETAPMRDLTIAPNITVRGREMVSFADLRKAPPAALLQKAAQYESLIQGAGEKINLGDGDYRPVPQLRAVPAETFISSDGTALENRAGHVLFQLSPGDSGPPGARPVVYDVKTGNFAVVTGALEVKWSNPSVVLSLAQDYQLKTLQSFDQLGLTYYQSTKTQVADLVQLMNQLKSDSRVVDANLHLLKRTVKPQ